MKSKLSERLMVWAKTPMDGYIQSDMSFGFNKAQEQVIKIILRFEKAYSKSGKQKVG